MSLLGMLLKDLGYKKFHFTSDLNQSSHALLSLDISHYHIVATITLLEYQWAMRRKQSTLSSQGCTTTTNAAMIMATQRELRGTMVQVQWRPFTLGVQKVA